MFDTHTLHEVAELYLAIETERGESPSADSGIGVRKRGKWDAANQEVSRVQSVNYLLLLIEIQTHSRKKVCSNEVLKNCPTVLPYT